MCYKLSFEKFVFLKVSSTALSFLTTLNQGFLRCEDMLVYDPFVKRSNFVLSKRIANFAYMLSDSLMRLNECLYLFGKPYISCSDLIKQLYLQNARVSFKKEAIPGVRCGIALQKL